MMCDDTQYIAIGTAILVLISEVLPFMDKYKSNGLIHALVFLLNSECLKRTIDDDSDSDAVTSEEFNAVTIGEVEMIDVGLSDSSSGEFSDY
jgi:hypothetical protein